MNRLALTVRQTVLSLPGIALLSGLTVVIVAGSAPSRVLTVALLIEILWIAGAAWRVLRREHVANGLLPAFLCVVLVGVAASYFALMNQASQTRLELRGVVFPMRRGHFTVGTVPGVSARLAIPGDSIPGWQLFITRQDSGAFRLDSLDGIDAVAARPVRGSGPLRGAALVTDGAPLQLSDRDSGTRSAPLALVRDPGGKPVLVTGADTAFLAPGGRIDADPVLEHRREHDLRAGLTLDRLHWSQAPPEWASSFSVSLPDDDALQRLLRLTGFRPKQDLILTPSALGADLASTVVAAAVEPGDTIEVSSGGRRWEFALESRGVQDEDTRLAVVRFVRNPRPLLYALPPRSVCTSNGVNDGECGLVSSHLIPGTSPLLYFAGLGLDTARYFAIGRAVEGKAGVIFATHTATRDTLRFGEEALVAAFPTRASAGYLLRFTHLTASDGARIIVACIGLLLMVFGAIGIAKRGARSDADERLPVIRGADATVLGMVVLAILGLRLTLGLRIAEANPYVESGRNTAFAMWCVVVLGFVLVIRGAALIEWLDRFGRRHALVLATAAAAVLLPAYALNPGRAPLASGGIVIVILCGLAFLSRRGTERERLREKLPMIALCGGTLVVLFAGVSGETARLPLDVLARVAGYALIAAAASLGWSTALRGLGSWAVQGQRFLAAALTATVFLIVVISPASRLGRMALFATILVALNVFARRGRAFEQLSDSFRSPSRSRWLWAAMPAVLLVLMARADTGLALVAGIPLTLALLLAIPPGAALWRRRLLWSYGLVGLVAALCIYPVFFPRTDVLKSAIRSGSSAVEQDEAFRGLGGPLRFWPSSSRALVRGIAAHDPEYLEAMLLTAGPSAAREEIIRSIEQVQGGLAYAVAGWSGEGLVSPAPLGRGVPTAVAYAENTFDVFVVQEHGVLGALAVLILYLSLPTLLLLPLLRRPAVETHDAAFLFAAALLISIPAWYVAGANLGIFPLTGQNIPFLGLNSWVDVLLYGGLAAQGAAFIGRGEAASLAVSGSRAS